MREPFFCKQTSCWYVWADKKMVRLARNKEEAYQKWHRLKAADGKINSETPVVQVLDKFLDAKKSEPGLADRTFDWYRNFIQSFASHNTRQIRPRWGHTRRLLVAGLLAR